MELIERMKQKILVGGSIGREEALELVQAPLEPLCKAADEIRQHFCGNAFDMCTIINGKSGRCSEDCKFCAQSAYYQTQVQIYPLLSHEEFLQDAKKNESQGVPRYSIVTSGKKLAEEEVDAACESIRRIRQETGMKVCASFGLLNQAQYEKLKAAGVDRVHNNLETSWAYFPSVCTTHTYEEKLQALRAAQQAGMELCSGGIVGLGETMADRIDMALTVRETGVTSIPVNLLNPIPGTPYEKNKKLMPEDMRRIVAIFRFLIPDGMIRLAGGRGLLPDKGEACFRSGANAAISGEMLTTSGITVEKDLEMLKRLGYELVK